MASPQRKPKAIIYHLAIKKRSGFENYNNANLITYQNLLR